MCYEDFQSHLALDTVCVSLRTQSLTLKSQILTLCTPKPSFSISHFLNLRWVFNQTGAEELHRNTHAVSLAIHKLILNLHHPKIKLTWVTQCKNLLTAFLHSSAWTHFPLLFPSSLYTTGLTHLSLTCSSSLAIKSWHLGSSLTLTQLPDCSFPCKTFQCFSACFPSTNPACPWPAYFVCLLVNRSIGHESCVLLYRTCPLVLFSLLYVIPSNTHLSHFTSCVNTFFHSFSLVSQCIHCKRVQQ